MTGRIGLNDSGRQMCSFSFATPMARPHDMPSIGLGWFVASSSSLAPYTPGGTSTGCAVPAFSGLLSSDQEYSLHTTLLVTHDGTQKPNGPVLSKVVLRMPPEVSRSGSFSGNLQSLGKSNYNARYLLSVRVSWSPLLKGLVDIFPNRG